MMTIPDRPKATILRDVSFLFLRIRTRKGEKIKRVVITRNDVPAENFPVVFLFDDVWRIGVYKSNDFLPGGIIETFSRAYDFSKIKDWFYAGGE